METKIRAGEEMDIIIGKIYRLGVPVPVPVPVPFERSGLSSFF